MKRLYYSSIFLIFILTACTTPTITLVPPETLVYQTLAAIPKTSTPVPTAEISPTATIAALQAPATPALDFNIPGANCLPQDSPRSRGLVTKVLSGDTIEVLIGNQAMQVRLIGVAAPSLLAPAEWQAGQSMSYTQNLVEGKNVILVQDAVEQDPDGTKPRYVLIGSTFANYEIVRQGFAKTASNPPNTACDPTLLTAQVEAQSNVRGLWVPTPLPTFTMTLTPTITLTPSKTSKPVCSCESKRLTCNSFKSQGQAQRCYEYCLSLGYGDIFGLDKNSNGLACEGS